MSGVTTEALAERSDAARLRTRQEMLTLSFIAYVGMWGRAAFDAGRLRQLHERFLGALAPVRECWRLVWGPAVARSLFGWHDHVAFAVEDITDPRRIAIAVRGTNPLSLSNISGVGAVFAQVDWPLPAPGAPRIGRGVDRMLRRLLRMRAGRGAPGAGLTLIELLRARASAGARVVHTTGHSLGGTLASTLALLLADAQGSGDVPESWRWDREARATVGTTTFAAFSAGNPAFAAHSDARLGARCDRVAHPLDVTARTYARADLEELERIYEPHIATGRWFASALGRTRRRLERASVEYAQLAAGPPLASAVRPGRRGFMREMMWQHVQAYVEQLQLGDALDAKALLLGRVTANPGSRPRSDGPTVDSQPSTVIERRDAAEE